MNFDPLELLSVAILIDSAFVLLRYMYNGCPNSVYANGKKYILCGASQTHKCRQCQTCTCTTNTVVAGLIMTETLFPRVVMDVAAVVDPEPSHYDVLLSSYMRGGSTLTGAILGWRQDAFYVYEPLWKMSRWAYWRGNASVCRTDIMKCRDVPGDQAIESGFVRNKYNTTSGSSLIQAQKCLYKLYDCQMNHFERQVVDSGVTVNLGGPGWNSVKQCLRNGLDSKHCVNKFVPEACKRSRHIVTKVLRFTLDNVERLLAARPNLKIIHLFRDPRAIINSRIATNWYPIHSKSEILDNAHSLCDKMRIDFHEGKRLMKIYPNRFKFLYYEDLNKDPMKKVKLLYQYLKMDLNESKYKDVRSMKVFKSESGKTERERNTAFWWRRELDWDRVHGVDTICKDVYDVLGYKVFSSERELKNMTLPSVAIPRKYLL